MENDNFDETSSGDGEDVLGEWNSCLLLDDAELSLPRVRASSVARGNGHDSCNAQPQHQHHPLLNAAVRSPTSPTYSLCGSRLRWINTVEQLLLGVPYSHRPALSVPTHTKRELCNVNGKALSRRQLCHRNRDTRYSNQIYFISVAHFPFEQVRRDLKCAPQDESRIFATNHTQLTSSATAASVIKTQEFSCSISRSSGSCDNSNCICFSGRFTSFFAMPVPESFRSTWSTDHVPALHISSTPDKLKKLKEIRRDDNFNIEEVTETEVPASRLHSGSRNGNGHLHHYDDDTEQLSDDIQSLHRQPKNPEYSESVTVSRIPAHQEYREGMRYDIENPRRYRDAVQIVPGQTNPGRYYSTFTQCYINSSYRRRRYRETVYIRLNAPNPKQYSTKVFVFPQSVRETFVSEVDHHDEETIKWYKVGVKMEARDYVSVKFMQVN